MVKTSEEDPAGDGRLDGRGRAALAATARQPAEKGGGDVIITRAEEPALALVDGRLVEVAPPRLEALDHRGAGDSLTAGVVAALARGDDLLTGLRLGAAAGAMNVTRRGLGTGNRSEIERLAQLVEIR